MQRASPTLYVYPVNLGAVLNPGATLEHGCLVTRVPSSVGLFGQEMRSLLSVVRSLLLCGSKVSALV